MDVPPLRFGIHFLDRWPIRETPGGTHWKQDRYTSFEPGVLTMDEVTLHSDAGILLYEDLVVSETLKHAGQDVHRYTVVRQNDILIDTTTVSNLSGSYISLLTGSNGNYFHDVVDSVSRLALIPKELLRLANGILIPSYSKRIAEMLELLGNELPLHIVHHGQTINVEHLVFPTSLHGEIAFHPCLMEFLSTVARKHGSPGNRRSRRIYVDRRDASNRKLVNESELIDALSYFNFECVALEKLAVHEQVSLFREAEFVVAPHGAGLTNLAFAERPCFVLELQMDAYVNWAFRRFCALQGITYDCLVGRSVGKWTELNPSVHGMKWLISIPHVVAAISSIINEKLPSS